MLQVLGHENAPHGATERGAGGQRPQEVVPKPGQPHGSTPVHALRAMAVLSRALVDRKRRRPSIVGSRERWICPTLREIDLRVDACFCLKQTEKASPIDEL